MEIHSSDSIEYTVGSKATADNVSATYITPPPPPPPEIHQIPESSLPRAG